MGQENSKSDLNRGKKLKLTPEELAKQEKFFKRRKEIINELYETEERYFKVLSTIVKGWLKPLRAEGILKEEELKSIFSIIEVFESFHESFLEDLKKEKEGDGMELQIGQVFVRRGDALRMYTTYVNNYNNSITTFSKLREQKPALESFFQKALQNPDNQGLDLSGLLIAPVQRIPRYQLLLQDLLKNTPEYHPGALEKIKAVAEFINEEKRDFENIEKIYQIQATLGKFQNLVEPHRRIIKEGTINIVKSEKNIREISFYLFNDMLLLTKLDKSIVGSLSMKPKWKVVTKTKLVKTEIKDVTSGPGIFPFDCVDIIDAEKRFTLISSDGKSVLLATKDKEQWIKDFYWYKTKASSLPVEEEPVKKTEKKVEKNPSKQEVEKQKPPSNPPVKGTEKKPLLSKQPPPKQQPPKKQQQPPPKQQECNCAMI